MLFHVTACADPRAEVSVSPAVRNTLDTMRAEGVVIYACSCVDGAGYILVVEAGDADEAVAEMARLSRAAAQPLEVSLTAVRSV